MKAVSSFLSSVNVEIFIWPLGLIALATMDPEVEHMSLCLLKNLGFEHCPGCGVGRSIAFIFQGEFMKSFQTHPLGGFAIMALVYRVGTLIKQTLNNKIS